MIWNHIAALTKTKNLLFQISCMKVIIKAETRRENSNQKEPKKKKTVTVYFSDYILLNIDHIKSSKILQKSY